jgi:GntR family transcriptional regulator
VAVTLNMATLPEVVIDRASPVPLYFQLAELFEQEITSGRWRSGACLPSEPEIGSHYELSRTTIRQALSRLEQRRLVQRHRGRGTFVQQAETGLWALQSSAGFFQEEVDRRGRTVTSQILRAEVGTLPRWATDSLGLSRGARGVTLERLRSIDGKVAMYVANYLPLWLADVALAIADPSESLYRRLRDRAGLEPHGGRRTLAAVAADERLAEQLELNIGAPLVLIHSVAWDAEMRPFDCYRSWLRTDRTEIEIYVSRSAPAETPLLTAGPSVSQDRPHPG